MIADHVQGQNRPAPSRRGDTPDEAARLAALDRYAILDTPPEAAFDDIVRAAARVCDAPISVINLIAADRQWFKAEVGLGARETPLDVSICAHVLLQPGLTVVPDLREDPRFNCNPLVKGEPHLRFYAGALLETPDGYPIGTLCVLDHKTRPDLTEAQKDVLLVLARQVMTQLELRRVLAAAQRTEVALQRSEERLRLALDAGRLLAWEWDPDTRHSIRSGDPRDLLGLGPDATDDFWTLVHPEDRPRVEAAVDAARRGDAPYNVAFRLVGPHGVRWVAEKGHLQRADGDSVRLVGITTDITEHKQAEATLRDREEHLRVALEAAELGTWDFDPVSGRMVWSDRCKALFGLSPTAELSHELFLSGIHPEDRARVAAEADRALDPNGTGEYQSEYQSEYRTIGLEDGVERWVATKGRTFFADGRAVRFIGAVRDITAQKQAEATLRDREERLRLALDVAQLGTWDHDPRTGRTLWSDRYKAIFGLSPEAEATREVFLAGLHPEDRERVVAVADRALDPEGTGEYADEFRTVGLEDGVERWVTARGRAFFDGGRPVRFLGVAWEVTAQKWAEREREAALAQRTLMLRELHHRVKNSLQSVASLLRLQGHQTPDPALRAAFDKACARIDTIAEVHTHLYQTEDVERVDFASLLRSLGERLARSLLPDGNRIALTVEAEPHTLSTDRAIPLSLIVNEIVTNAAKYAFPDERSGTITVRFHPHGAGHRLSIHNTGRPLPEGMESGGGGLGFLLVRALTQQVGGTLSIERGNGTRFSIDLPL